MRRQCTVDIRRLAAWRTPRQALPCCLLVLAAVVPGAAYPTGLQQLLRLPLEELLQLEITGLPSAPRSRAGASLAQPIPCNGSLA